MKPFSFLLLLLLLPLLDGCLAGAAKHYQTAEESRLAPGMTQEAVEKALGIPAGFHRRWLPSGELREIWVYHYRDFDPTMHLYPKTHFVVFSDGKVIAENPHDPYAPKEKLARGGNP